MLNASGNNEKQLKQMDPSVSAGGGGGGQDGVLPQSLRSLERAAETLAEFSQSWGRQLAGRARAVKLQESHKANPWR